MPCVRISERFCYFDCNIFYFGRVELSWNSSRPFVVVLFPIVPTYDVLQKKNIWPHLTLSRVGEWVEAKTSF